VSTKETSRSIGLLDDFGAVGLAVRIPHSNGSVVVEAVDGVGEIGRKAAFDLVGLYVEECARRTVPVVGFARYERAYQGTLSVIDVARRPDDDVFVVRLEDAALLKPERRRRYPR